MIRYDDAKVIEALRIAKIDGASESERRTGVKVGTIRNWAKRANIELPKMNKPTRDWDFISQQVGQQVGQ